jgi:hypothetical protein
MKTLPGPADIHTDDEGTRLTVIHVDSRAREDAGYIFFFGAGREDVAVVPEIEDDLRSLNTNVGGLKSMRPMVRRTVRL